MGKLWRAFVTGEYGSLAEVLMVLGILTLAFAGMAFS